MLRPAHSVAEGAGPLAARVGTEGFRHLEKERGRDPADLFDHRRGVAGKVALDNLENTVGILQRRIVMDSTRLGTALRK